MTNNGDGGLPPAKDPLMLGLLAMLHDLTYSQHVPVHRPPLQGTLMGQAR